jgi:DNA-binding transcriptional regulator YiaG
MSGKQIKAMRKKLMLTQTEFADRLHVSFATLNRWERGRNRPLPDRMERLKEWSRVVREELE